MTEKKNKPRFGADETFEPTVDDMLEGLSAFQSQLDRDMTMVCEHLGLVIDPREGATDMPSRKPLIDRVRELERWRYDVVNPILRQTHPITGQTSITTTPIRKETPMSDNSHEITSISGSMETVYTPSPDNKTYSVFGDAPNPNTVTPAKAHASLTLRVDAIETRVGALERAVRLTPSFTPPEVGVSPGEVVSHRHDIYGGTFKTYASDLLAYHTALSRIVDADGNATHVIGIKRDQKGKWTAFDSDGYQSGGSHDVPVDALAALRNRRHRKWSSIAPVDESPADREVTMTEIVQWESEQTTRAVRAREELGPRVFITWSVSGYEFLARRTDEKANPTHPVTGHGRTPEEALADFDHKVFLKRGGGVSRFGNPPHTGMPQTRLDDVKPEPEPEPEPKPKFDGAAERMDEVMSTITGPYKVTFTRDPAGWWKGVDSNKVGYAYPSERLSWALDNHRYRLERDSGKAIKCDRPTQGAAESCNEYFASQDNQNALVIEREEDGEWTLRYGDGVLIRNGRSVEDLFTRFAARVVYA